MPRVYDFQSCGPWYHAVTPSCGAAPHPDPRMHLAAPAVAIALLVWKVGIVDSRVCSWVGPVTFLFQAPAWQLLPLWTLGRSVQLSSSMFSPCPALKTRGVFSKRILPSSSDEHPKSMAITCAVWEVSGDFWPVRFAYEIFPMFSCFRHWVPIHGPNWEDYGACRRWMMAEQSMWLGVDFDFVAWSHPLPVLPLLLKCQCNVTGQPGASAATPSSPWWFISKTKIDPFFIMLHLPRYFIIAKGK